MFFSYIYSKDLSKVTEFVESLEKDKILGKEYGINARKYVSEHFSKVEVLKQFKETIVKLTA